MVGYMLRIPEASQKDRDKPDVLSYVDNNIDIAKSRGAKLCMKTGKSVEIVSFSASNNFRGMREYGEFQYKKGQGLTWTSFAGHDKWVIYKVTDFSTLPLKMTKTGRL